MSFPSEGRPAGEATSQVTYCFKWNSRRNRAGVPLSEAEAREQDAGGDEYTAVVPQAGSAHPVLVTVVWKNNFVGVSFIDEVGRKYMQYSFYKKNEASLFLTNVVIWTYPNDDPKLLFADAVQQEEIQYREDGYVRRILIDKTEAVKDTTEYSDVPVDDNWEPVPTFGDYRSIARKERSSAAHGGPIGAGATAD
jgi:hypothetical protein